MALKQNHDLVFSSKGNETLHASFKSLAITSSCLTKDATTKECNAPESINTFVEVLAI